MPYNLLKPAVFFAGLGALCWIGAGYIGTSVLALGVVLLITACYIAGGLELRRYHQATAALSHALANLAGPVERLSDWLQSLPASLRHAVRQRIEGERVALPAPALTPYLVGLLVLLGMLGTLLGMMTTLRSTGLALASATDLDAIRTSLSAPVQGLAFAFGTSIAGVAASAMLGLLSALCRRERALAVQALDAAMAATLRPHSNAHQRELAFELLQRQVEAMPMLVERLQAAMAMVEQQGTVAHERQLAQQAAFHERSEAAHVRLAGSVERALKDSVADSARAAAAALQPVAESTMVVLAHSASSLHDTVLQATQRHLDALSERMHDSTTTVADLWTGALAQQRESSDAALQELRESLQRFGTTFDQRSAGLVDTVAARFESASATAAAAWTDALSKQTTLGEALARHNEQALSAAAATFGSHAASLVDAVHQSNTALQSKLDMQAQASAGLMDEVASRFESASDRAAGTWSAALSQQVTESAALARNNEQALVSAAAAFESRATSLVDAVQQANARTQAQLEAQARSSVDLVDAIASRFDAAGDRAAAAWSEALSIQKRDGESLAHRTEQAFTAAVEVLESHARSLIDAVRESNACAQQGIEAQAKAAVDRVDAIAARFETTSHATAAAWTEALSNQAAQGETLARNNERALVAAAATFESHAASLVVSVQRSHAELQASLEAQTQAHARATLDEIARLVHDAAEAPKAAAEVIAELRQSLSESLARDTAVLEERGRLLETVETLLAAVNRAAAEQRTAVDALIATSAEALERVATRFTAHVEAGTGKLDGAADRIAAGAIEVASLGDVFGLAVQRFGESNEQMATRLQAIEGALDRSLLRSDEQLAYYVAQAREVVDLSVLAQKQIIGELQRVAHARVPAETA